MLEKGVGLILFFFLAMGVLEVRMGHASISLPKPSFDGKASVEKTIKGRRSIRDFKERTLSLTHLSQLLWAAQGITDPIGNKRAAPSGGALYPLDIYILIGENGVEKIEAGVYHYLPKGHSVLSILKGDRRKEIASASLGQMWMLRHPSSLSSQLNTKGSPGNMGKEGFDMPSLK